jgi:hypothetical protein
MSAPRLTLHIDRVVLRGIDPLDQRAFTSGLEQSLARLLRDPELRTQLAQQKRPARVTPVLRLGRTPLQPGLAGARALGAHVAQGIARAVRP